VPCGGGRLSLPLAARLPADRREFVARIPRARVRAARRGRHGWHRAYAYAELLDLIRESGFDDVGAAEPRSRSGATTTFIAVR
jgi:hypothetical protein